VLVLLGHVTEALETKRTLILVLCQFFEALLVHRVSAVQEDRLFTTLVHVLHADRTVSFDDILDVSVVILDLD
jgi:hypothetical protein